MPAHPEKSRAHGGGNCAVSKRFRIERTVRHTPWLEPQRRCGEPDSIFEIPALYLKMMRAQVHPLGPHDSGKVFHRREFLREGATHFLSRLCLATVILYHSAFVCFLTFKGFTLAFQDAFGVVLLVIDRQEVVQAMSIYERYELLDIVHDGPVKTFRAPGNPDGADSRRSPSCNCRSRCAGF